MPVTANKTGRVLQASASNGAGATTIASALDLSGALGLVLVGRVSNGASAPTAACTFIVEISHDGSTWRELSRQTAGRDANAEYDFVVEVPAAILQVRCVFTGNTGQAVTIEAIGHELTSVG